MTCLLFTVPFLLFQIILCYKLGKLTPVGHILNILRIFLFIFYVISTAVFVATIIITRYPPTTSKSQKLHKRILLINTLGLFVFRFFFQL